MWREKESGYGINGYKMVTSHTLRAIELEPHYWMQFSVISFLRSSLILDSADRASSFKLDRKLLCSLRTI